MRRFIFIVASFFSVAVCCGIALAKTYFLPEYNPIAQTRTSTIDGWPEGPDNPDPGDPDDPDPDPEEECCDYEGYSETPCDNYVKTCICNGQTLYLCNDNGGGDDETSCADDGYTLCVDECEVELDRVKVKRGTANRLLPLRPLSKYDVYGFPKDICRQKVGDETQYQYYYKPDGGFSCGGDYNALDELGEHQVLAKTAGSAARPVTVRCGSYDSGDNSGDNGGVNKGTIKFLSQYVYNLGYKGFMEKVSGYPDEEPSFIDYFGLLHYYYKPYTKKICPPTASINYLIYPVDPFRFICYSDYCDEDGKGTDNRENFCEMLGTYDASNASRACNDTDFSISGPADLYALTCGLAIDENGIGVPPSELYNGCTKTLAYDGGYWKAPDDMAGRAPEYCYDGNKLYYKLGECASKYEYTNELCYLKGDTCEYDGVKYSTECCKKSIYKFIQAEESDIDNGKCLNPKKYSNCTDIDDVDHYSGCCDGYNFTEENCDLIPYDGCRGLDGIKRYKECKPCEESDKCLKPDVSATKYDLGEDDEGNPLFCVTSGLCCDNGYYACGEGQEGVDYSFDYSDTCTYIDEKDIETTLYKNCKDVETCTYNKTCDGVGQEGVGEACTIGETEFYESCTCNDEYQECGVGQEGVGEPCTIDGKDHYKECIDVETCPPDGYTTCSDKGQEGDTNYDSCTNGEGEIYYEKCKCTNECIVPAAGAEYSVLVTDGGLERHCIITKGGCCDGFSTECSEDKGEVGDGTGCPTIYEYTLYESCKCAEGYIDLFQCELDDIECDDLGYDQTSCVGQKLKCPYGEYFVCLN